MQTRILDVTVCVTEGQSIDCCGLNGEGTIINHEQLHCSWQRSHAPLELNVRGGAVPPVSPEVIKILLLQRSCRLMDAPSEHVIPREFCDGSMSK